MDSSELLLVGCSTMIVEAHNKAKVRMEKVLNGFRGSQERGWEEHDGQAACLGTSRGSQALRVLLQTDSFDKVPSQK